MRKEIKNVEKVDVPCHSQNTRRDNEGAYVYTHKAFCPLVIDANSHKKSVYRILEQNQTRNFCPK